MQEVRFSTNSSTQQAFINAAPPYNEAIARSGFNHTLTYKPNTNRANKKKRKGRSILWFNPPFSSEVTTNITILPEEFATTMPTGETKIRFLIAKF